MAKPVMTITGMDNALRNLRELPKALRRKAAVAVRESALAATESMRTLVPEKSGTLKRSIFSDIRGTSGWVRIGVDAFYWHFLEFGTINMPARPFIRPAAELEAPHFRRRLEVVAREIEDGNAT